MGVWPAPRAARTEGAVGSITELLAYHKLDLVSKVRLT